ncbi:CBS domain-containing protein [Magnetospirillum sp. SS-4]|uniref:CBS domain-containing protein n=1 Tax=Magnetospirillum sp. SS-4 TaxID=2681465 RepID=UPI00137FD217|nr:CBS domain-containing protein [Magnetospirillum sp. SS-4]CAA7626889.1 CBS domain-containing protein [Magnetospirillum sp. SS-4]
MNVGDILDMKGNDVYSVRPGQSMAEAAEVLAENRIGVVLVRHRGEVTGILSERDIIRAVTEYGPAAMIMQVRNFMSSPVKTCASADSVSAVVQIMNDRCIRHLPVVDYGSLNGMISITDIVRYRLAEKQRELAVMRDYAVARV